MIPQCRLTVRQGELDLGAVHVSVALLADRHLSSLELRWALKERDIAGQVRSTGRVTLDHEMLSRRYPRPRSAAEEEAGRPTLSQRTVVT